MDYLLFFVMTVITVHVHAGVNKDNVIFIESSQTNSSQPESITTAIFDRNSTISDSVVDRRVTNSSDLTTSETTAATNAMVTEITTDASRSTEKATTTTDDILIQEILDSFTGNSESTTYNPNQEPYELVGLTDRDFTTPVGESLYPQQTDEILPAGFDTNENVIDKESTLSTETNKPSLIDSSTASSEAIVKPHKTTEIPLAENSFKFLDGIHPENSNLTDTTTTTTNNNNNNNNNNATEKYENMKKNKDGKQAPLDVDTSLAGSFDPDKMPPQEFLDWLNSIHPDLNASDVVTVTSTNIIDTSIISTDKLIIVISTICGTFVLFVIFLIVISCCRRKRNMRNDSEKSDFSVTSVVSAASSIPDKRLSSGSFSSDKNGFNNLFMGIPANNEVWKNLEHLSPADSSIMPESTKM